MTEQKVAINPSFTATVVISTLLWQYFIFIDYTCDEFGMYSLNVMFECVFENSSVCFICFEIIISDSSEQQEINKTYFHLSGNTLCGLSALAYFALSDMLGFLDPSVKSRL